MYCHVKAHKELDPDSDLSPKRLAFVEEFCKDYNGTRAAMRAGYSEKTAPEQASRLLKNVKVKNAINKRMEELSMSAEEAVKRLTDWGRGTARPFLRVDEKTNELRIDLSSPEAQKNLHLIKKLKQNDTIIKKASQNDPDEVIGRSWEIELHDQKDAVDKILKVHGKYAPEKLDVSMKADEWDPEKGDPREYVQKVISKG